MTQTYRKANADPVVGVSGQVPADRPVNLTVSVERSGWAWYIRGVWMGVGMAMGFSAVSWLIKGLTVLFP